MPVRQDALPEHITRNVKYGIAGVRYGTFLLTTRRIHWNVMSHQERDKFITRQAEVILPSINTGPNIPTLDNAHSKYCNPLFMLWVGNGKPWIL
jgi:hypothetical protein